MRFSTIRKFALALAEVTEEPHHESLSWRVRGKIFVTVPPGNLAIHAFVPEEERERLLAIHPGCIEQLMWGTKAAGVRVAIAGCDQAILKSIIHSAWRFKAPKDL